MSSKTQPATKDVEEPKRPITDVERKQASDVVKKAKVQLTINHPFFAQIVLHRRIEISDKVSRAYITQRGRIVVGTRFAAGMKVQQMVFLLAHEAMHYAMLHLLRRKHRDMSKWNVACDAVINDLLEAAKVGEFIEDGVKMPGSKDKTSEKVYDELPDGPKGGKGKGKSNAGGKQYQPGEGNDDLSEEDGLTESETREVEEQIRQEVAQAATAAKQQGTMPAGVDRWVDDIINPKTPWQLLLERYMTSFVKADYSWRRPNRRLLTQGLYLPSADKVPQMGEVVLVVDTSGSIAPELPHFLGHINAIMVQCRPERVYVMHSDAEVHKVDEFELADLPIKIKDFKGGGGTDFRPAFRMVEKMGIEPEVLIYFTDMYGSFPDKPAPYNTVWLSTTKGMKAPWGDVVFYDCEANR